MTGLSLQATRSDRSAGVAPDALSAKPRKMLEQQHRVLGHDGVIRRIWDCGISGLPRSAYSRHVR